MSGSALKIICQFAAACALVTTSAAQTPSAKPDQKPAQAVPAKPAVEEVGGRLVVTGETVDVKADLDLLPRDASVASKIDIPLLDTPRSVTILDRRTLDDMSVVNITQAHDYAIGFTPIDERGPASSRGFPVDFYDLRRDGLRTYSWSVREPAALDRIQYLRGPSSILYGDGSPGGLVNLVLKKPLPVQRFEVNAGAGELGFGRFAADATGPLVADRSVRYRVIAAGEWFGNGIDNDEQRFTLLPMIAFEIGDRATLSLDTEIYSQSGRNYRHVVPITAAGQTGDFSAVPWDLSIASPDDDWSGGNVAPGARLDLAFNDRTTFHAAARYTRIDGDLDLQALANLAPDGRTANRFHYREISVWDEYQSDMFFTQRARTGRLEHHLVVGLEAGLSSADSQIGVGAASPIDIYDPIYLPPPSEPALAPTRYDVARIGVYATDQIHVSPVLTVVPGLRWSYLDVDDEVATATAQSTGREAASTESAVSPSIGVVVHPRPWLALYSTFSRGFEPPTPGQYLEDGGAPALSENSAFEGGVKADVAANRLSLTAAAFRIGRTNIPEADGRGFYRQIGEGNSRGVELEVVGRLAPGLTVLGGYAFTDTEITQDVAGFAGRQLPNAPRHDANVWMRYRFGSGSLRGLMTAGGVVHVSDRFLARDNLTVVPAYTRLDASASYPLASGRLTVGLVAQNLTDRRYVTSGAGAGFFAAPSRRIALQVTTVF
jgi:iron complex outermembrane receptor protein